MLLVSRLSDSDSQKAHHMVAESEIDMRTMLAVMRVRYGDIYWFFSAVKAIG